MGQGAQWAPGVRGTRDPDGVAGSLTAGTVPSAVRSRFGASSARHPRSWRTARAMPSSSRGCRPAPPRGTCWMPSTRRGTDRWPWVLLRTGRCKVGATSSSTTLLRPTSPAATTVRFVSSARRSRLPGCSAPAGARRLGKLALLREQRCPRRPPYSLFGGRPRRSYRLPPRRARRARRHARRFLRIRGRALLQGAKSDRNSRLMTTKGRSVALQPRLPTFASHHLDLGLSGCYVTSAAASTPSQNSFGLRRASTHAR